MKNKYYRLVERGACDEEKCFPINWSKLPDSLLGDLPEWYIEDLYAINEGGDLVKRSMAFVQEMDKEIDEEEDGFLTYPGERGIVFCIDLD